MINFYAVFAVDFGIRTSNARTFDLEILDVYQNIISDGRLDGIHEMSDQFNRGGKNDGNRKYTSVNLSQHFNKPGPKSAAKSTTG